MESWREVGMDIMHCVCVQFSNNKNIIKNLCKTVNLAVFVSKWWYLDYYE